MMINREQKESKLTLKDSYWMLVIILIYGIISFVNLGSLVNPQTFWTPEENQTQVVINLGEPQYISKIRHYSGPRFGDFKLSISADNINYEYAVDMPQGSVFSWREVAVDKNAQFIMIEVADASQLGVMGEVALYGQNGERLHLQSMSGAEAIIDEPDTVPETISYLNSMYFDEIYHGRTAYEFAHGMEIYEWTHPPLGKLIMSLPLHAFGMNTFSYRLMGNISGILMLVVIYIFAKRLFGSTKYAALAMGIFAVDGMHFVQTRIGTVDTFLVLFMLVAYLFMYQYVNCKTDAPIRSKYLNLLGSGIALGCAMATKWTGAYMAIALAIVFFMDFYRRYKEAPDAWLPQGKKIILSCFGFFVGIPCLIYVVAYIPTYFIKGKPEFIPFFINEQTGMYNYHSGLNAEHPYSSNWSGWPIGYKPVWYYSGSVGAGNVSSISLHSNVFVWWTGLVAMIWAGVEWIRGKNKKYGFLVIGILAVYVPYILIPRIMYLYHYFPVVPLMILCTVGLIKKLDESTQRPIYLWYMIIAAGVFAFCYPIYSGLTVPEELARLISLNGVWKLY